jgi:indole-3-glycerol phosphate synthase
LEKIVAWKYDEIATARRVRPLNELHSRIENQPIPKDFLHALRHPRQTSFKRTSVALIAEVKKASPSKGIIRSNFDPVAIARIYESNGADCLSVLTDENFFQGHLNYLQSIRMAVEIPLLRKDFVLDDYQIFEARAAGADAVLLIAECLDPAQLIDLHDTICGLGMIPLIELYDEKNLDQVLNCQPALVGINNRDLNTFEVDFGRSLRIKQRLPQGIVVVSESGIQTSGDVRQLENSGIDAMLVGESLMRLPDIGNGVRELLEVA